MISGKQIRAARSLLDMTQGELADLSGISKAALIAIEQEHVAPRVTTISSIEATLTGKGIKFSEGHGVALSSDIFKVEVFEGDNAFESYMQSTLEAMKTDKRLAVHSHIEEHSHIRKHRDIFKYYYDEMAKHGLRERLLICEGVKTVYGSRPMAEYRWIKEEYFNEVGYGVFGDKYAILFPSPMNRTVVIENKGLAETFRRQFKQNWENAIIPKLNTPLYEQDRN